MVDTPKKRNLYLWSSIPHTVEQNKTDFADNGNTEVAEKEFKPRRRELERCQLENSIFTDEARVITQLDLLINK